MRAWTLYASVAVVAALAAVSFEAFPVIRDALLVVSGLAVLGTIVNLVQSRSAGRYDLDALRRVHEQAEVDEIQLNEPADYDSVQCMCCGEPYSSHLPVCPRCRRSQY